MFEATIKHLIKDKVLLFQCPAPYPASKEELDSFISSVFSYIQNQYPNHGYNVFEESNRDDLTVVAIIDINDIKITDEGSLAKEYI